MTLFDIFYRHTNWWYNTPKDSGKDTYHVILDEMEVCATEYAKELRGLGEKWKLVIERETIKLCNPNHYSFPLRGEKKEWHDMAVKDFLCRIRKAMEHYCGCDFLQLPERLLPFYGFYGMGILNNKKQVIKPHLSPSNVADGQLQGNGQNKPLEAEEMPINEDMLPTIGDEETKELEQRVFLKVIEAGFMSLNADNSGYSWKQGDYDLAFMCGCIYWGDEAKENKAEAYKCNYTKDCHYLYKSTKRIEKGKPDRIRKLFPGKDTPDDRYHYKNLDQSKKWEEIDKLIKEAMAEVKAGK